MSERIVSALAKMKELYVEQVRDNDPQQRVLEEKMQQVNEYKKLDPVGRESKDGDINNDGKKNKIDSYLLKRRVVRTRQINKNIKPPVAENVFYSWRDTVDESLLHEINDVSDNKIVKEKKVDNYAGKTPVVTINPEMKTESVLIDSEELNEDFIEESIDIATEYLCEEGLSVEDVEDLIDELGAEEFSEWVMQIGYETLLEWRRGPGGTKVRGAQVSKGGKHISTLKGGAKTSAIRATPEHKQRKVEKEEPSTPSGMTAALKSQSQITKQSKEPKKDDVKKSTTTTSELPKAVRRTRQHGKVTPGTRTTKTVQPNPTVQEKPTPTAPKRGPNTEVRNMVRGAVADAADFINRGNEARKAARKKGLAAGLRSFFFKPEYHEEFEMWVDNLLEEGYDLSEYTWDELYEEYENLYEVKGMGGFVDPSTGNFDRRRFSVPQAMYRQPELHARRKSTLVSDNTPLKPEPSLKDKLVSKIKSKTSSSSGMTIPPRKKAFAAANKAITRGEFKRANKIKSIAFNVMEEYELQEKAVSEQQQKLFGLALSVKRGETSRDKVSPEVLKIVNTMSEAEIRKYAATPHEDVPKKKELAEKVIQFVRQNS